MPMAVWRGGMDKIEAAARAVDMPLRLDNANALPTYPQLRQAARSSLILEGQGQARLHLKFNPSWSYEWGLVQFKSPGSAQKFLSTHATVYNTFNEKGAEYVATMQKGDRQLSIVDDAGVDGDHISTNG